MLLSRLLPLPAALLLPLLVLGACQSEEANVTVSQLHDAPQQYLGERVTVSGAVERVFGETSFTVGNEDGDVLVVFVAPSAEVQEGRSGLHPFQPGDSVRVTGQARRFATAVSERDAEQTVNIDYADDNPALVASRVHRLDGRDVRQQP